MSTDPGSRCVIFLDIDGVLQPDSSQRRFKQNLDALRSDLSERFQDPIYRSLDKYDLGAVFYDWDRLAVGLLRGLCEKTGAQIVISSDWRRRRSLAVLRALFRIHGLQGLVVDKTGEDAGPPHYRAGEVRAYLHEHPEIERFAIIDDSYTGEFNELFAEQFVQTVGCLDEPDARRVGQILSGGPVTQKNRDLETRFRELRQRLASRGAPASRYDGAGSPSNPI